MLVENGDIKAMAETLLDVINDNEKRLRLSANAVINIERFGMSKIADKWKQLFDGL